MITIAVTGAAGRMGQRLVALGHQHAELKVVGALERAGHPALGRDAGEIAGAGNIGVPLSAELGQKPDVMIDFSAPAALAGWIEICRREKVALVVGTTGLGANHHALIDAAAADIAILQAPNMSLGVNLLFKLVADAARRLGDDYDIEVFEAHHRFKKDAPSGTALGLADSILNATGKMRADLVYDRHGDDCVRQRGQIGMHALRMGDEVGLHTVYFAALGERLELTHRATNRDTFVHGALKAAAWLAGRKPGHYSMADVLGL